MKIAGIHIDYNSGAFKTIFERLFPAMCMVATNVLHDEEKGRDVAQEAFIKLFDVDTEEFESENALKAYLYVLVKNACISLLRKERLGSSTNIEEVHTLAEEDFLHEILREETYRMLRDAINELSPQAAKIVNLSLKGFSNPEIAEDLDVTINTVKTVKKRAYKTLKNKLGDQYIFLLLVNLIQFF